MAESLEFPSQTPLFHAVHADRYQRQELIREYEATYDCRLVVLIDAIFPSSVTIFEELVHGADPDQDLHILVQSPGGDGETAVRLIRSAQARCKELTVIVPDQAKSAATVLAMGAHRILMGPSSDLGPVDPQFRLETGELVAAKDIIAAVEAAEQAIQNRPETYPLHASLLSDITSLMVQQARSALARTGDLVEEALMAHGDRTTEECTALRERLREPLIDLATSHQAVFGANDAANAGLPVTAVDPATEQWELVWRLWSKYFVLSARVYEGRYASHVLPIVESGD